jgi:predicted nucleic acid-binding protein
VRYKIAIVLGFFVLLGDGVLPYQDGQSAVLMRSSSDFPVIESEDLRRIERISTAFDESRWEDAFLELLILPAPLRELVIATGRLDSEVPFSEFLRDRCWRHIRDRLAVLDRPGGSSGMQEIYPRLERIPIVCVATGVEPPRSVQLVLQRWSDRILQRIHCDEMLLGAEKLLLAAEHESAVDLLDGLLKRYPGDRALADHIGSLKRQLIDRTRRELQLARDRADPSSVLQLASRLNLVCEDDSQALRMTRWARGHLNRTAEQLIESNQMSTALLILARLVQEGEPVAERLQQLRERIAVPLRPRIVRGQVPEELESSKVSILVAGIPTITIDKTPESRSPSFRFSEVGRRWTRSPAHYADVKRWHFLLDEIQQLTTVWLHARPQEAILLSARLSFHVSEALRISRRMAENSPRRSRVVWQEWAPVYPGDRWRIQATLPIWLIDQKGREIGQSIDVRIELSPSDPGRDGLLVTQAEIDRARRKVIASIDRELEKLASQIARSRLLGRLQEARALADRGDLVAAQELLVPALIGSQEQDQDLQEQATGELANWSQLGVTAVRTATGGSSSP